MFRFSIVGAASLFIVAALFAQEAGPDTLRLTKLSQQSVREGVILDYTFDVDISQRLPEFSCECTRAFIGGSDAAPIAPKVAAGPTPTAVRVKVDATDLRNTTNMECTLSNTIPATGMKRTIITATVDLTQRRELAEKSADLSQTRSELARYVSGDSTAQKPTLTDVTAFPERALIRLSGNPCGSYQVHAKRENEEHTSKPSLPGSSNHTIDLDSLSPGKTYDLEYWQVNSAGQPIASTRDMRLGALITPKAAADVAFTSQQVTPVESGLIVEAKTNVPAAIALDVREYNTMTGTAGSLVQGKQFERDEYHRPMPSDLATSAKLSVNLAPGKSYQYRLRGVNADGVETSSQWEDYAAVKTLPLLDFTSPVEIAITPVGFVVTWSASMEPDEAVLTVDYGSNSVDSRKSAPGIDVSMALGTAATKDFLAAMSPKATTSSDKTPKPKLIVEIRKKITTTSGSETRTAKREFRIALLQEKEETKAALTALALAPEEKTKLIGVAEKAVSGRRGTKFNWGQVFSAALKIFLAGT